MVGLDDLRGLFPTYDSIAHSYGWKLLFITRPRTIRLVHGTRRQLNGRTELPAEQISPPFLCQCPGRGTGSAAGMLGLGHAAGGKPSGCLPGSPVHEALLAGRHGKN